MVVGVGEPTVMENGCLLWNVEDARWSVANCGLEYGYLCRGEELVAVQELDLGGRTGVRRG